MRIFLPSNWQGVVRQGDALAAADAVTKALEQLDRKTTNSGRAVMQSQGPNKPKRLVAREGKASTSFVQRYLQIGYNRAARIVEEMERQGVISAANAVGKREVLIRDFSDT